MNLLPVVQAREMVAQADVRADEAVLERVAEIVEDVRREGDRALLAHARALGDLAPAGPWVHDKDALDAARREVKRWRLEQLTHLKANADLDPASAFFVLAWDAFKAPVFAYDEALRLARAVGVDLDDDITGRLAQKKGSDIVLWDSARRAAKGALGPPDGSRGMIDAIHHAANLARSRTLDAARELLSQTQVDQESRFFAALEAVLEVLPVSRRFSDIELEDEAAASGSDFEALYDLSRLAYSDQIDEPEQLKLWQDNDV